MTSLNGHAPKTDQEIQEIARNVRISVIEMLTEAGNGHPGGSLSLVDLLTVMYFQILKHDPKKPDWEERERFVLSKGHGVPAQYAVLAETGYFAKSELLDLRKLGSRLQGHPDRTRMIGIEASTGSLGQGGSIAQGMALAERLKNRDHMTYCVMGDGEIQEGQVWEMAMSAPMHKLDHFCCVVDWNKAQIDGFVKDVMNVESIGDKFRAFGWNVIEIDGHDIAQIRKAYLDARANADNKTGKPTMIVADTIKGKGVSFMEGDPGWHGVAPSKEEAQKALAELKGQN